MPAKVETTPALPGLSPVGSKPVLARFDGGHLCSDGGLLVLREVEQRGLSQDWGSSGGRHSRTWVIGWLGFLSEAGAERAIVDGAADLQQ